MCCRCGLLKDIEDIKNTIDKWEMRIIKDYKYNTDCGKRRFQCDIVSLKRQRDRIDKILKKYD